MCKMIWAVFFDVGGVLGPSTVTATYEEIIKQNKNKHINKEQFRALLMDPRLITGPAGTLEQLLQTEFSNLRVAAAEILAIIRQEPLRLCEEHRREYCKQTNHTKPFLLYKEAWAIARELDEKHIPTGIISDQFAESAAFLRRNYVLNAAFDPALILFSPEVGLRKETTEIFNEARRRIDKAANTPLMIDDHWFVLDVAEKVEWKTLLCNDYRTLREDLRSAYGLPLISEGELQEKHQREREQDSIYQAIVKNRSLMT